MPGLEQVEIFIDEDTLLQPLHWKRGRLIFPCSMTDWMADFVPDEFRDKMLAVMGLTPQHTYLSLTKRADRQRRYFTDSDNRERRALAENFIPEGSTDNLVTMAAKRNDAIRRMETPTVIPNLWLGTSVENPDYLHRLNDLANTPAFLRWASFEPLLADLGDIRKYLEWIGWAVGGFESGAKARPGNPQWGYNLRDQCVEMGVPFFWKQNGEFVRFGMCSTAKELEDIGEQPGRFVAGDYDEKLKSRWVYKRIGKKAAGRLLDGKEWSEYPKINEGIG